MGDIDNNNHMNLLSSLSTAMFDGDPGDESNHPAQQYYNDNTVGAEQQHEHEHEHEHHSSAAIHPAQHYYSSDHSNGEQEQQHGEHSASVSIGSPDFPPLPAGGHITNSPPFLPLQAPVHGGDESSSSTSSTAAAAAAAALAATAEPELGSVAAAGIAGDENCGRPRSDSEVMRNKSSALLKEQWLGRYNELIEYKRKHGHCNVPQREKKLGCWVSTQRTQYKLLFEGRQSQMNQERIDLLNALDFDWDPRGIFKRIRKDSASGGEVVVAAPKGPDRNDRKWMSWYNELIRFKEQHGHCMVTRKLDNSLGIWVQKQRKLHRELQAGKTSKILTPEKVDLLNQCGFVWEVPPGSRPSGPKRQKTDRAAKGAQDEWHQRLDELKKYKEEHGNCLVPESDKGYAGLFEWASAQRQNQDKLSRDLKRKLDEIDFEWDGVARTGETVEDWNQKFFELSQFKVIHGHTNVAAWPSDPQSCSLAEWCTQQRYNYENLWANRYSPLTEERIKQLNQLGFDWTRQSESTPADAEWSSKLQLLKQYKMVNGHCNVPRHHEMLGDWADAQRLAMKNLLGGTPPETPMTWDRFSQLEAVGFEFSVRASVPHCDFARAASMQSQ